MLQANRKYRGEIVGASLERSAVNQTPGLAIHIECPEGSITHTLWLSEKAKANSEKKLKEIGVTETEMKSGAFWSSVDSFLVGKRVKIETEEETYKDKVRVRVKWFNADKGGTDEEENLATFAARFFGGGKPPAQKPVGPPKTNEPGAENVPAPTDDDYPF